MSKFDKLLTTLLFANSDNNFHFDDVVKILLSLGFKMRINGSHHIFTKENVIEIINLQPKNNMVKAYQVKQVREIIIKYKLWQNGKQSE